MQQFDTLIVGQGIAGSLVAYQLHKLQRPFRVLDAGHTNSASRVAAGMFTPVSGKRKTVSKDVLQQIAGAIATYREIELLLGTTILHQENVYQLFDNEAEKKLVEDKASLPGYCDFFIPGLPQLPGIACEQGGMVIRHSGWVNCPLFIKSFGEWLLNRQLFISELFNYDPLQINSDSFQYKNLSFKNIVFCEGYRAAANPFFTSTIIPCKGDIIGIAADEIKTPGIIKKNAFYMLPADDGSRRVGATFKWHNSDEALHETDRQQLEQAAAAMLSCTSFTTVSHHSAIRATTPGQQVIAKEHPSVKNMFMLNGLGTKGVLLGPYYAAQLVQAIG